MSNRSKYNLEAVLPFWVSLLLVPIFLFAAFVGSWAVLLPILATWYLFNLLDWITGRYAENPDLDTPEDQLFWYRAVTLVWPFAQFFLLVFALWYVPRADHLGGVETITLFLGVGVITGAIGINYSHELMHQRPKLERRLSEWLLAMVLYSRFKTEHLLVHHIHVGTPRDTVTARYNEHFHRYFNRVMLEGFGSAWAAEKAMLARKDLPATHRSNPFWRYFAAQGAMLVLAFVISGWLGLALFVFQAFVAIWQLELINYIEHYGLTRQHLGEGKYEHVKPRHSWNAEQRASNWLLINLQRHSNHHYNPRLRFPLLQTYGEDEAPLLPYGYPVMSLVALYPRAWRRMMNPRVQAWRERYYPDVEDWTPYNKATTPTAG